jgi:hypothetical protein
MFLLGDILHNAQGNKLVIARTFAGAGGSGGRRGSTGGEANDDVTQISHLHVGARFAARPT